MANKTFGAKEVMDVTLYKVSGDDRIPFIYFDSLKTSSLSVTSEKVYARGGKGNPKLLTWEINKEATLTIEDALISPKSFELISGNATATGTATVNGREKATTNGSGVVTLSFAPTSASTVLPYLATDDCGAVLSVQAIEGAGNAKKFTILDGSGATVNNTELIVYYQYTSANGAETYTITSDKFAGTYMLVGDTVLRNEDGTDEPFQLIIPQLKWTSSLELGFAAEGDPATTSFECEVQKPAGSTTMVKMVKYS